jgi:hypothetical protein
VSKNNDSNCNDSKCPAKPIIGGHTKGLSTKGPAGNADCSGKGK